MSNRTFPGHRILPLFCSMLLLPLLAQSAKAADSQPTTTKLSVTVQGAPVTQVAAGTAVTLTARVEGPASVLTRGQVKFCVFFNGNCLGVAQITSAGTASLTLIPNSGNLSYVAYFLGVRDQFQPSSSPIVSLPVMGSVATTTTLTATGGASSYLLTATVQETGSAAFFHGLVSFTDTSTQSILGVGEFFGSPVSTLAAGPAWPADSPSFSDSLLLADFNNDGIRDVVGTQAGGSRSLTVLLGTGQKSFKTLPPAGVSLQTFVVGDFNGDGFQDIAGVDAEHGVFVVLAGKGDGTFQPAVTTPAPSNLGRLVTGDFNRDGLPDLAAAAAGGGVSVFAGDGKGGFSAAVTTAGDALQGLAVGDFNRDGVADLAGFGPNGVEVLLGDGLGGFPTVRKTALAAPSSYRLAVADLDLDGYDDLAATATDRTVTVLLNKRDGTFTAAATGSFGDASRVLTNVVAADFNQDGVLDLAVKTGPAPGTANGAVGATVLFGLGLGQFGDNFLSVQTGDASGGDAPGLLAGDLSGDGYADLIAGGSATQLPVVLVNTITQSGNAYLGGITPMGFGTHLVQATSTPDAPYAASTSRMVALLSLQQAPAAGAFFQIMPRRHPDTCLDVAEGSRSNGTPLIVFRCGNPVQANQSWRLVPAQTAAGNGYQVISVRSGACMDVPGGSQQSGVTLIQWQCGSPAQTNQVWQLVPSGSSYRFVSLNSGKCMVLPGGNTADDVQVQQTDCDATPAVNLLWDVTLASEIEGVAATNIAEGPYQIQLRSDPAACADVAGGSLANGTRILSFQCATPASPNQLWRFIPAQTDAGNGYRIVSANSGSCMDVAGGSPATGAPVLQWMCGTPAQTNQVWQLYPYGTGYEFVSVVSGKCLHLPLGAYGDVVGLEQSDCGQGRDPNQIWNLAPVPAPAP